MKRLQRIGAGLTALVFLAVGLPGRATADDRAAGIIKSSGVKGGLVVHLGCGGGKLTAALRAGDRYLVHGLDTDANNVTAARKHIRSLGLYGMVSVQAFDGTHLPYAENLVNLLVADRLGKVPMAEVMRVLAPRGVAIVGGAKTVKPWPDDMDEWTHDLHDAGGNPVAADRLVGPPRRLRWTAGPLWARSHGYTPSVSSMVSARGRLFYILDETLTGAGPSVPSKWALVARDAFNSVLLWKRPIPVWGSKVFSGTPDIGGGAGSVGRFTMPPNVGKRLVAVDERVYVTLGPQAPATALDAATGKTLRVYEGTARADEILHTDGKLIVSINPDAKITPPVRGKDGGPAPAPDKTVCAIDAETGRVLWTAGPFAPVRTTKGQDPLGRLELAAGDGRVIVLTRKSIDCIDIASGKIAWRIDRPALPPKAVKKAGYSAMYEYELTVMVYHDGVVLLAQPEPDTHHTYHTTPGTLYAFDAKTGKQMWKHPYGGWGHHTQHDVFVVNGVVWTHVNAKASFGTVWGSGKKAVKQDQVAYRIQGLDLRTGKLLKEHSTKDLFNVGHHHRCYRNRITERFLTSSRRGVEFVDLATGVQQQHHWVRSGCLEGNLPCNGLLYVTPHPCGCYREVLLTGFNALAAEGRSKVEGRKSTGSRLEKGPAYGKGISDLKPQVSDGDWATYRHDARRSGGTESAVSAKLAVAWKTNIGAKPTGLTIAGGKVYAAGADAHTVYALGAKDGESAWSYTADARVDSPPTIHAGLAIFGSTDGRVYCLRTADGALAWRFDAAPQQRRVMAFGQLESPWPVSGSVLVQGGKCWFSAGRMSYLDGGIALYAGEPTTGKVVSHKTIYSPDPKTGIMKPEPSQRTIPGVTNDILGSDGASVFMRQMNVSSGEAKRGGVRVYSTGGFLDSSWFNRTFWKAGKAQTSGLMVLGAGAAYGVELYASRSRETVFAPGTSRYRLVCRPLGTAAPTPRDKQAKKKRRTKRPKTPTSRWEQRVAIRVTAMVRAGETLFVAGSPDTVDPADPHGAWEGRKGGVLAAFATTDGKKLAEYTLPAPPVWDGLAAANGRLYIATTSGDILAFKAK